MWTALSAPRAYKRRLFAILIVSIIGWSTLGSYSLRVNSIDCLFRLRGLFGQNPIRSTDGVRIVYVDVGAITNTEPYCRILRNLTDWDARAVVFDIVFTNSFWNATEAEAHFGAVLRDATAKGVKVIFASQGNDIEGQPNREVTPASWIVDLVGDSAIGYSDLMTQRNDGTVRRYPLDSRHAHDPLAVVVARSLHEPEGDQKTHWINYYGPPATITAKDFREIISVPTRDFRTSFNGKTVFIGQGPPTQSGPDQHKTPFPSSPAKMANGVEIHATIYCNLIKNEWLTEPLNLEEWGIAFVIGILAGSFFSRWPLRPSLYAALSLAFVVATLAVLIFIRRPNTFSWLTLAGPQLIGGAFLSLIPVKTAFISYRRVDGRNVALLIANEFNRMGIGTFIDIKEHKAGRLSEVLLAQIARRRNFVLILTPGVIERWKAGPGTENDWIGQEIEQAIALKRVVIPVTVDDFRSFVETNYASENRQLPSEVRHVLAQYRYTSYFSEQPDTSITTIARKLERECRTT